MKARTKSESEKERRAKARKRVRPRTPQRGWLRTRAIVRTESKGGIEQRVTKKDKQQQRVRARKRQSEVENKE